MLKYLRPALAGLFLASSITGAEPDFTAFSHDDALAHSQQAIGRQLSDIELTRADGSRVSVEDYRGRPLVISMMYTSCHHICPTTTQNLHEVVAKARQALDTDSFQVISVGFDTVNDNPARMARFGEDAGVSDPLWDFLSVDAANRDKLVEQLGFIYTPSPKGFNHLIQASVVDAQGKIYRQVYGISFPTPQLIEPLKELVFGQPVEQSTLDYLSNRIRLFCTVYDPATDNYHIDISVFIGTFVGIIVSILFGRVLFREWRRSFKADQ